MKKAVKISIIVPIYNTAKFLPACLDSILAQSFRDFEIIAVNDGSRDESAGILSDYSERYPDIIRIIEKENGGLSSARNAGIKAASGEYLAFIDSDDTISPDFLSELIKKAESDSLDIVSCDFYYRYDFGADIAAKASKGIASSPEREYLISAPMACIRLIKRELLAEKGFTENIYFEDLDRMPKLLLQSERIGRIDKNLYYYYQRRGSIMNRKAFSERDLDIIRVLRGIYSDFDKAGKLGKYKSEIEYLFIEHLLRSAALRFCEFENRKELFGKMLFEMREKFPEYKKNPYLKKSGIKFRAVVFFASHKIYAVLCLIKRSRG